MKKAPWQDYSNNDIFEGDVLLHPSGQSGRVQFNADRKDPSDQWVVNYGTGFASRLCLQVGDKGQGIVLQITADS